MAELLRTHPLEAWAEAFARLPESLAVTAEPFVAMVDVRLGTVGAEASAALGVDLPTTPNTWVPAEAGRAVWLGPDEWLLTSERERPEDLEARIRDAVVPLGGAAVDVSAQRIAIRLTGSRVRDLRASRSSENGGGRRFPRQ